MDPPQLTPAVVQAEIKKTRHKKEVPLYVFLIIIGLMACVLLILRDAQGDGLLVEIKEFLSSLPDLSSKDPDSIMQLAIIILSLMFGAGAIIILVVMSLYQMYRTYADQMSYSIRVSEKNYPEIYQKVREYTWLLGWKKEPEVYVQQMNGSLNAFTCWVPGKVFIQLNAEIVDIEQDMRRLERILRADRERVRHIIQYLERDEREIVRLYFLRPVKNKAGDLRTWQDVEDLMHLSHTAVMQRRKKMFDEVDRIIEERGL